MRKTLKVMEALDLGLDVKIDETLTLTKDIDGYVAIPGKRYNGRPVELGGDDEGEEITMGFHSDLNGFIQMCEALDDTFIAQLCGEIGFAKVHISKRKVRN
ncbi:hypothetical protein [Bacillus paranthracis]|uniref:hypothetical protein n=1 Tax=Bacillus paranthracis TaxID=2026186 RepID=UPI0022E24067|nr:hypothetical protein [Bacillus paranthracis]